MKLKKRNNRNSLVGDNSFLPLVNIIFLLLIFFLLVGVIEKRRDLLDVKLPEATLEQFSESDQPELHVYPNGRVRVSGTNIKIYYHWRNIKRAVETLRGCKKKSKKSGAAKKRIYEITSYHTVII